MLFKPTARWLRRILRRIIEEDGHKVNVDVTEWHDYLFRWNTDNVVFEIDGHPIFSTPVSPLGPLGLVLWIDNQYALFDPTGKIKAGTLENQVPEWMEIEGLEIR
jgi:hypothetical protein